MFVILRSDAGGGQVVMGWKHTDTRDIGQGEILEILLCLKGNGPEEIS